MKSRLELLFDDEKVGDGGVCEERLSKSCVPFLDGIFIS